MSEMSSTQYIKKLVAVKFLRSIGYDIITKQEHDILIMVRMNNQQLTAERDAWKKLAERLKVPYSFDDDVEMRDARCIYCGVTGKFNHETVTWEFTHSPDCPIEQLRDLQRSEG